MAKFPFVTLLFINFLQYTLYPTKSGFSAQVYAFDYIDASIIVKYGSNLCRGILNFCRQLVKLNIFLLKYKKKYS